MEEGAVEAPLRRIESSVVDTVFVLDAPLPLLNVSGCVSTNRVFLDPLGHNWVYLPITLNVLEHVVLIVHR